MRDTVGCTGKAWWQMGVAACAVIYASLVPRGVLLFCETCWNAPGILLSRAMYVLMNQRSYVVRVKRQFCLMLTDFFLTVAIYPLCTEANGRLGSHKVTGSTQRSTVPDGQLATMFDFSGLFCTR